MSTETAATNQTEILARSLDLSAEQFTEETARFLIALELGGQDRQALECLAEKARQGFLSETEKEALEEFRRAGRLMEMMRLKARQFLSTATQSPAKDG